MRDDAAGFALLIPVVLGVMFVASRAQQAPPATNPRVATTHGPEAFVASGLSGPWEVTWGPGGFLWETERVGKRVVQII